MRFPAAVALVALGGAAGTYARVVVSLLLPDSALAATLAVNLAGAFALGFLATSLADGVGMGGVGAGCVGAGCVTRDRRRRRQGLRLLLGTGFCGGFTTYSLIALQAVTLLQQGSVPVAVLYGAATLALGAAATLFGVLLASRKRAHDVG